jgi:ribosome assembly protein SQT1
MSHANPAPNDPTVDDDDLLDADDAAEEIPKDPDHPMDLDDDDGDGLEEEIQLQNDSIAHFDAHTDSIFCIAAHPLKPSLILTGGGDDVAYIFDSSIPEQSPGGPLPREWENNAETDASRGRERPSIAPRQKLDGHTDSVNAVAFTLPKGAYALTAGLDGKLRAWQSNNTNTKWRFIAEVSEVKEINWLAPCPNPAQENVVALGANDGSVWVYQVSAADKESPLTIVQAFYLHTESCTAGTWSSDGKLLATVSEDGSFYAWDVFGTGQAVVSLTAEDQRFAVEGGLYSVAVSPNGSIAAVGGAEGHIKVVGLPQQQAKTSKKGKGGGSQQASSAGQILASLQPQTDGVETLSFSSPPLNLLAAGSVDGSIALFDTAHRFAVRRHIKESHEEFAVVKVEFGRLPGKGHLLTSAGMDGVVRRWDARGGTTAAGQGFIQEWRGHRGDGEGGGVLGFVQGPGGTIVTAGDDGVALVFKGE